MFWIRPVYCVIIKSIVSTEAIYIPAYVQPWQEGLWILLTCFMFFSWWAYFARKYATSFSLSERILAAFTATVGQILATTLILGIYHQLEWLKLGTVNLIILIIVVLQYIKLRKGRTFEQELQHAALTAWRILRSSSVVIIISVLSLLIIAWVIYLGQLMPPFSWDAWGQHLGWAAMAHQEMHLGPYNIDYDFINFYPKNMAILFLWWIIGAGTERWANISQAPFALMSVIACYILAKRVGAKTVDAICSGLLILSIQTVFHMMWVAMTDLALMGGFLTAMAFLSRRRLLPASVVLAGIITGFSLGTKGSSLFFLVGGPALFLVYRLLPLGMDGLKDYSGRKIGAAFAALLIFGSLCVLLGGYFFIRNWVLEGNPVAPHNLTIGEVRLFEGSRGEPGSHFRASHLSQKLYDAVNSEAEWFVVFDGFFDPRPESHHGSRIGGWGPVWTILMLPAIPIALLIGLLRKRWAVVAIISFCLIPYFLFPYNHTWTRFLLPVIGAGTTAFAFILTYLRRTPLRRVLLGIGIFAMGASLLLHGAQSNLTSEMLEESRAQPYQQSNRNMVLIRGLNTTEFNNALNSVKAPGTTLAYTDILPTVKYLAFWNSTYTNRVVYVPFEDVGEEWESALLESSASAVYVAADTEQMSWAESHPDMFKQVFISNFGGIFEILEVNNGQE